MYRGSHATLLVPVGRSGCDRIYGLIPSGKMLPAHPQLASEKYWDVSPVEGAQLRSLVHMFIRAFGLLSATKTPCGNPISVSQAHALMVLLDCARDHHMPTQRELGQALGIDKSNVARLCRRMENESLISQKQCSEDKRARRLMLTDKGTRLAARVEQSSRERFAAVLSAIPPFARSGLFSALEALNTAVHQTEPKATQEMRRLVSRSDLLNSAKGKGAAQ